MIQYLSNLPVSCRGALRFWRDRTAVAATELALLFPIFLILLFGEFSSIYEVKRRLSQIDTTLGDLLGRADTADDATVLDILAAAETIMVPYALDDLQVQLTAIEIDGDGNRSLLWSRSSDAGATNEIDLSLPDGLGVNKQVIRVETSFDTSIQLAFLDVADITLETIGYVIPRNDNLDWQGQTGALWSGAGWEPPPGSPDFDENAGTNDVPDDGGSGDGGGGVADGGDTTTDEGTTPSTGNDKGKGKGKGPKRRWD